MQTYTVEIDVTKTVSWFKPNTKELHRVGLPAVECANGTKYWYLNGQLHRVDGPALEYADGSKLWYLNGKQMSEAQHKEATSPVKPSCEGKIVVIDGKEYELREKK